MSSLNEAIRSTTKAPNLIKDETRGIGSLSLHERTLTQPKGKRSFTHPKELRCLFPDRDPTCPPSRFDQGPGPCQICLGSHSRCFCPWENRCPLNAEVGEHYKVVCHCGSGDVIKGECRLGCSSTFGHAVTKKTSSYISYLKRIMDLKSKTKSIL